MSGKKLSFVGRVRRSRHPALFFQFNLKANLSIFFQAYSFKFIRMPDMKRVFLSLFSSPESLLQVMSQQEIIEAVEDGDRIIIDQDGNASVNYKSNEVRQDFLRHVNALKRA
jgi:hypothetical protein